MLGVSVVVPTTNRLEALKCCLHALARQTVAPNEILVVDDGDQPPGRLDSALEQLPAARLIRTPGLGPAAARNVGARTASTPLVCFVDDDCQPASDWLDKLTAPFEERVDAVAGATIVPTVSTAASRASQALTNALLQASLDSGSRRLEFAPACNLACRAEVLSELPFDETYLRAAGEDRDWCARFVKEDRLMVFAPSAIVTHHSELSLQAFWRQQVRYGRGAFQFRSQHPSKRRLASPQFYAGLLRKGFAEGPREGALVCAAQLGTAVGVVREALDRASRRAVGVEEVPGADVEPPKPPLSC